MRSFFRPPPNDLNFGTHDLLQKQRWVSNILYFFKFLLICNALQTDWSQHWSIPQGGIVKYSFSKFFFHSHDWHMWFTMFKKVCVIWRWWEKSHFFKNWLNLDQMAPPKCGHFFDHLHMTSTLAHMIYCTNKGGFQRFYIFLNFLLIYNALQTHWSNHRSIHQGGIVNY